jgi:hypothetical protein
VIRSRDGDGIDILVGEHLAHVLVQFRRFALCRLDFLATLREHVRIHVTERRVLHAIRLHGEKLLDVALAAAVEADGGDAYAAVRAKHVSLRFHAGDDNSRRGCSYEVSAGWFHDLLYLLGFWKSKRRVVVGLRLREGDERIEVKLQMRIAVRFCCASTILRIVGVGRLSPSCTKAWSVRSRGDGRPCPPFWVLGFQTDPDGRGTTATTSSQAGRDARDHSQAPSGVPSLKPTPQSTKYTSTITSPAPVPLICAV